MCRMDTPTQQVEEIAIPMVPRPLIVRADGCRQRIPVDRLVRWGERKADPQDPDCPKETFVVYYNGECAIDIVVDDDLDVIDKRYDDATA